MHQMELVPSPAVVRLMAAVEILLLCEQFSSYGQRFDVTNSRVNKSESNSTTW